MNVEFCTGSLQLTPPLFVVMQPFIRLAHMALFSLAFLHLVRGIISSPKEEIPVIMCSAKATSGSPQRATDAVIWSLAGSPEILFLGLFMTFASLHKTGEYFFGL